MPRLPATKRRLPARGRELVDVKIFTSSGMIAPASVPQVMIVASFHHSVPSPKIANQQHTTRSRSSPSK